MLRTILIASLSVASAFNKDSSLRPALKLRGGLAGIDASAAATVGTWLGTINGVYCGIAEGPACEAYGVDNPSFNMLQIVKNLGYTFTSAGVLALCLMKGVAFNTAFAWSQLPWLLLSCSNLLNGVDVKMGIPKAGMYLLLAINAVCMYCGFTDSYMPLAATLYSAWGILNGVMFALAPSKGAEAWGVKGDAKFEAMFKNFGYALISNSVLTYFTGAGTEVATAVGYMYAVQMVSLLDGLFVSKTFDVVTSDKMPAYAWLVIQAAVIAGTLA